MRSLVAAGIGVAVGIWMMIAPAVLGYAGSAATSDRILGPTAAAVAWIAATEATRSLRWVNVPLGLWVLASPLVLDHSAIAAAHSVTSGVLLIATALAIGVVPKESYGGGWKALLQSEKDGSGTDP